MTSRGMIQFVRPDRTNLGPSVDVPLNLTKQDLENLLIDVMDQENLEDRPSKAMRRKDIFSFLLAEREEIITTLQAALEKDGPTTENVLTVNYFPTSMICVRPVTRCSASMKEHEDAVLCAQFSPDSHLLATGSGDCTVKFWDLNLQTVLFTGKGHENWVLCVEWSPCGRLLLSGGMDRTGLIFDVRKQKLMHTLKGHREPLLHAAWQPLHRATRMNQIYPDLVTCSKDGTAKIWHISASIRPSSTLSGHTQAVQSVRWSAENFVLTGSRDRTVRIWDPTTGLCLKNLDGHGHWVNSLTLNTDYFLKTGAFDHESKSCQEINLVTAAKERFKKAEEKIGNEMLISASDDFTLILWNLKEKKLIRRITGHQGTVFSVRFSPDGRFLASASADKSIKIWCGRTAKLFATLRGHVGTVYCLAWAPDSRLLLSGSKDSTLKVWDVEQKKLRKDLPGHADEVYCVDWSVDSSKVVSGSKDRHVNIWRH